MALRAILASASCLLLCGCSYSYPLKAVVIGGKLAFMVDPASSANAACFNQIDVVASDDVRAKSSLGDDGARVRYGTFWHERLDHACVDKFPVFYGQKLKGKRAALSGQIEVVAPKPLRVGVIYEVTTTSGATGYGSGAFKILPDRTVINVPLPRNDLLEPIDMNGS